MKSQFLIGKYLHFLLLTVIVLLLPILAYPNHRVSLRARRAPETEPGTRLFRRQTGGGKIVSELLDAIKEALNVTEDPNSCTNCSDIKKENSKLKEEVAKNEGPMAKRLKSAYDCDKWENKSRTCWLDRNVGDTVTFVLAFAEGASPKVQWCQKFHVLHSKKPKRYHIDPDNPLWNMVIGSRGHELRLSPVTEMDVDSNFFSATVVSKSGVEEKLATQTINFRIRVMPIDQGFVYPGETLRLTMKSVDLPPTSMSFKWYLEKEGEERSLPSNMKVSPSGSVLTIWELRKEQEGVIACSVYTNLGFLATTRRFLIKEINQKNNQLLFEPTRPGKPKRRKRDLDSEANLKWAIRLPENTDTDSRNTRSEAKFQPPRRMRDEYDDEDDEPLESKTEGRRIQDRQTSEQDTGQDGEGPNQQGFSAGNPGMDGEQDNGNGPGSPMNQRIGQPSSQVVLEIERQPDAGHINAQEEYSKMIATCNSDLQCSANSGCIQRNPDQPGFCRCNSGFQGNGIFCWEENQPQNSAVSSSENEQVPQDRVKTPQLDMESRDMERGFE